MTRESDSGSTVQQWLGQLRQGSPDAAERLWSRYVEKLSALIRNRLRRYGVRRVDEEDVMIDVFASLCRGAERGRFPRLESRDDLWQVLVMLTNNKVVDQLRKSPLPHTESALGHADAQPAQAALPMVRCDEPTPEFAAEVADQLDHLMRRLSPEHLESLGLRKFGNCRGNELSSLLKRLVGCKLESMTTAEIAKELGWNETGVRRGVDLICKIWEKHGNLAGD